eukprot:SAG11_NODE_1189_length_5576_cov_3.002739_3_plen_83_part_00
MLTGLSESSCYPCVATQRISREMDLDPRRWRNERTRQLAGVSRERQLRRATLGHGGALYADRFCVTTGMFRNFVCKSVWTLS